MLLKSEYIEGTKNNNEYAVGCFGATNLYSRIISMFQLLFDSFEELAGELSSITESEKYIEANYSDI